VSAFYDHNPAQSDNSPKPNPAVPAPQPITNSNNKSDNSVSPSNSPQTENSGKDKPFEVENSAKIIKFEKEGMVHSELSQNNDGKDNSAKPVEKPSAKNDNQTLIINLKEVRKITLRNDGKLEIEFNNVENEGKENNYCSSISQVLSSEQITNNSELQKIKDYCQKSNKNSLNQQELNNLLQDAKNSSNSLSSPKPQNYRAL